MAEKTDRTSNTASYPKITKEGTFATKNNPGLHTKLPGQLRDRGQADPHVEAAYPEPRFSNVLVPAPESERPPLFLRPMNESSASQCVTHPAAGDHLLILRREQRPGPWHLCGYWLKSWSSQMFEVS